MQNSDIMAQLDQEFPGAPEEQAIFERRLSARQRMIRPIWGALLMATGLVVSCLAYLVVVMYG